jgi:DNA-directed RNA polymerase I, II, and III subunit RPABC1
MLRRMESQPYEDILIRSRSTILEMLEDRGFDTTRYAKLTGPDILKLLPDAKNPGGLMMEVSHHTDPERHAVVLYNTQRIKQSVTQYIKTIVDNEENTAEKIKKTDYIVITLPIEEIAETFDKAALDAWRKHQMRIQFFNMARLVLNPMKHFAQPKFEYVPPEEHTELLKQWHCRTKTQFPLIRFHNDPVARYMGLIPGDIVKITRTSYSAGEYILYRLCT